MGCFKIAFMLGGHSPWTALHVSLAEALTVFLFWILFRDVCIENGLETLELYLCGTESIFVYLSVQFSHLVVSDTLQPHGLQHARLPCPSPACSNSCPSSWWCHPIISFSVIPFSSCLQSFPVSGSFQWVSYLHQVAKSTSASVLLMNIQDWFPLGWTGLIPLQSKELSRVLSNTVQKYQFFTSQLSLYSNSHIHTLLLYILFCIVKIICSSGAKVEVGLLIALYRRLGIPKSGSPQLWCKPTACSAPTMAVSHCVNIYLFTWLHQELVAAHRIFNLHGSMWNLQVAACKLLVAACKI